ncbi:MAG: AMP-binding protein [Bdellovibrionota bacterium]
MKKIMTKNDFQLQFPAPEDSDLYFHSGGSSGEPKVSVFTYEDYHRQMELAAEGLFAAGLEPKNDLAMNLFFAGALYGGFISFFTILEKMQCRHFPMGAHTDHHFVAETIVKNKVNVLLGMPSYLLQLFQTEETLLKKAACVKKIFYGGEHFSLSQIDFFKKQFNVELIKSASYGSVDAGPLGFQCQHCTGSVHHLHHRLHDLEIVEVDVDKAVKDNEIGRLLVTSKVRKGQKIERYEIGDLGRWIKEPCPCGRPQPRFELMGRTGDVFRIGATFLNYQSLLKSFSNELNYVGAFQIHLYPAAGLKKEKIVFNLDAKLMTPPQVDQVEKFLLNVKDFNFVVKKDKLLEYKIELIDISQFEKSKAGGKIRNIVDHRIETKK